MPKYTKKTYEFVADTLWQAYNDPQVVSIKQIDKIMDRFADIFEEDSSVFDRERFVNAARKFQ